MDRITPASDEDDLPAPWEDRPVSEARWRKHRETLMQRSSAGSRPPEWWRYERNMSTPEHEAAALLRMGELVGAELVEVMTGWREKYEQAALNPKFCYCTGQINRGATTSATWLDGDAARRAHYRFWGIPRVLVVKWDRERIRNAKTVAKLKEGAP